MLATVLAQNLVRAKFPSAALRLL